MEYSQLESKYTSGISITGYNWAYGIIGGDGKTARFGIAIAIISSNGY